MNNINSQHSSSRESVSSSAASRSRELAVQPDQQFRVKSVSDYLTNELIRSVQKLGVPFSTCLIKSLEEGKACYLKLRAQGLSETDATRFTKDHFEAVVIQKKQLLIPIKDKKLQSITAVACSLAIELLSHSQADMNDDQQLDRVYRKSMAGSRYYSRLMNQQISQDDAFTETKRLFGIDLTQQLKPHQVTIEKKVQTTVATPNLQTVASYKPTTQESFLTICKHTKHTVCQLEIMSKKSKSNTKKQLLNVVSSLNLMTNTLQKLYFPATSREIEQFNTIYKVLQYAEQSCSTLNNSVQQHKNDFLLQKNKQTHFDREHRAQLFNRLALSIVQLISHLPAINSSEKALFQAETIRSQLYWPSVESSKNNVIVEIQNLFKQLNVQ